MEKLFFRVVRIWIDRGLKINPEIIIESGNIFIPLHQFSEDAGELFSPLLSTLSNLKYLSCTSKSRRVGRIVSRIHPPRSILHMFNMFGIIRNRSCLGSLNRGFVSLLER